MIKEISCAGIAVALIVATTPTAWAESGISTSEPEGASSSMRTDEVTATPGWNLLGTCEWIIDSAGCLIIRPASNELAGTLPNVVTFSQWPWSKRASSVKSARVEGRISCGDKAWGLFSGLASMQSIDLSGLDTSKVTTMIGLFSGCESLSTLDLSGFDTSNVTDMSGMFSGCSSLTSLDLSSFNTSNVSNMNMMFEDCSSLIYLDLGNFDTSNVEGMVEMFMGCSKLASLDLSSFNTSNITNMRNMYLGCDSLAFVRVGENTALEKHDLPTKTWYNSAGETFTFDTIPSGVAGAYATSMEWFDPLRVLLSGSTKTATVEENSFVLTATVTPTIKAENPIWSSSNPDVASVDPAGTVTVHKAGTTTITATVKDAHDSCLVTVNPLVIESSSDSSAEGQLTVEDAKTAKTLKGYSLLIRPSAYKGSMDFEQRLLVGVTQQQGKAGTIADLLDVCLVDSATGTEMEASIAGSLPPLNLDLDLNDDLKTQTAKNNLSLWTASSFGDASKTNAALKDNRFRLLATLPSTYAIIATPKSGSTGNNGSSTNPGGGNNPGTPPGDSNTPSTPPDSNDDPSAPDNGDDPTVPPDDENGPATSPDDDPTTSPDDTNKPPSSSEDGALPPASSDSPSDENPSEGAEGTSDKSPNSANASNPQNKKNENSKSHLAKTNGSSSDEKVLPQMGDSAALDAAPPLALAAGAAAAAAALSINRLRRKEQKKQS